MKLSLSWTLCPPPMAHSPSSSTAGRNRYRPYRKGAQWPNGHSKSAERDTVTRLLLCMHVIRYTVTMSKPLDLTGMRFVRLFAIKRAGSTPKGKALWECLCDCGKMIILPGRRLVNGNTRSCGCLKRDSTSARMRETRTTHGKSNTLTYRVWNTMLIRCGDPENKKFPIYGGRGITVCDRWKDFLNFLSDMGEKPAGLSIERINNNGNYEPDNCKWATAKEQANNTRRNRRITYNGETLTLTEWSQRLGITPSTLHERISVHGEFHALSMGRKR